MIYSMTAFGRSQMKSDSGMAIWEIRSINHRYLEIAIRLPDMLREMEQQLREIIHHHLKRGKIECVLRFQPGPKINSLLTINTNLLNQLITLTTNISQRLPANFISQNVSDLLAWDGVVIEEGSDLKEVRDELIQLFKVAVTDLKEGRQREGRALAEGIKEKIERIAVEVSQIKKHLPKLIDKQREKILQKMEEIKVNLDSQRLEQEMIFFVQKIDVAEEIERTFSHIDEVKRTLATSESVGKRLDFMMQELNREANTLASKSIDADITHSAVEIKVLIEQIREQVQNIE